jgi:NADH dehydrogenase
VTSIDAHSVSLTTADRHHERIESATVIRGAGVAVSPIARSLGVPLDKQGLVVEPDLSLPGHPEAFAVSDVI